MTLTVLAVIFAVGVLCLAWLRYTRRLDEPRNPCHIDTVDGEGD